MIRKLDNFGVRVGGYLKRMGSKRGWGYVCVGGSRFGDKIDFDLILYVWYEKRGDFFMGWLGGGERLWEV